jgi:hypothetical protein
VTRQDYQLIADIIRGVSGNPYMRAVVAGEFAYRLEKAFSNFDKDHFIEACKIDEHGHDGDAILESKGA